MSDRQRRLKVADVFCGAGGLSLGFAHARYQGRRGYDLVYGIDNDKDCIATYRSNLLRAYSSSEKSSRGALRSARGLRGDDFRRTAGAPQLDILIGGPNCQAVSTAGRRNLGDRRNGMFTEFVRLVEELRPRWFVMENVPGLAHRNSLPLLRSMLERLSKVPGYQVAAEVLLAADYGVPQYRYRLFVIGTRTRHRILFPRPRYGSAGRPRRNVRDAIFDLRNPAADTQLANHVQQQPDALNLQRIRCVPGGGDWRDIPIRLLPERNFATRASDQKGTYGRLNWNEPAFTITSLFSNVTAGPFVHPERHRPLTPREAARLQGFPDTFVFRGRPQSWARQIGNAVPPPLARAVAEEILKAESGAKRTGRRGRLTPERIADVVRGRAALPVLTPRMVRLAGAPKRAATTFAMSQTPSKPTQDEVQKRLWAEASLPGYSWTAKRAKAVMAAVSGRRSARSIATRLGLSESTVRRWITGYRRDGFEGWRAYHTSPAAMSGGDDRLRRQLASAISRARRVRLVSTRRPHMNDYVQRLVLAYGHLSVRQLIGRISKERGVSVGTVYVATETPLSFEIRPIN